MSAKSIIKAPRISAKGEYLLPVIIRDRTGILFEGDVDAVSSSNDAGPFDVLPLHANFISIIKEAVEVRYRGQMIKRIPVETGVLAVKEGQTEIYLGIQH